MRDHALLLALLLAIVPAGTAVAAIDPLVQCVRDGPPCGTGCIIGHEDDCAVSVHTPVCVTEPCDPWTVCVGWGRLCMPLP